MRDDHKSEWGILIRIDSVRNSPKDPDRGNERPRHNGPPSLHATLLQMAISSHPRTTPWKKRKILFLYLVFVYCLLVSRHSRKIKNTVSVNCWYVFLKSFILPARLNGGLMSTPKMVEKYAKHGKTYDCLSSHLRWNRGKLFQKIAACEETRSCLEKTKADGGIHRFSHSLYPVASSTLKHFPPVSYPHWNGKQRGLEQTTIVVNVQ